jgi:heme/copper-type cytochrome/quinol oxidase subunit 2
MGVVENIKEFMITHFSIIMLIVSAIFIVSSTVEIGKERNPKNTKDKLNTYYALNVTGLVFFSIFIIKEYLMPLLNK